MKVWSISSENGIQPQHRLYTPNTMMVSTASATVEPIENAMLRKRMRMQMKIANNARTTLRMAPWVISLATEGPTLVLLMIEPPSLISGFLNDSTFG